MRAQAGDKRWFVAAMGMALLGLSMSSAAWAQPQSAPAREQKTEPQTFVVEPIRSGFLFAPDVKVTQLDGRFGNLVGGYGGWLEDNRLFIGAGGYLLTNGSRSTGLSYGGVIVEWFATRSEPVTFSLRALVGGGAGNLPVSLGNYPQPLPASPPPFGMFPEYDRDRFGRYSYRGPATAVAHVGFFVTEPQMSLFFKLGDWLRLGVGGGYRFIGGASGLENRLKGPTGSVFLQFRFF